MGRTKAAFTGHTELKTSFTRKGAIKKGETGGDVRMYINYTQVEHKPDHGYIYEVNYDGQVFYNVFEERYSTNDEGGTTCTYPGENAFREYKQWAYNTNTLEEAKEILETFECVYQ